MSELTVNQQILDSVKVLNDAKLSPSRIRASGAGKAYQSVAQSSAIAVQDATDSLRNLTTLSMTAMGVAMSQFLATGEPRFLEAADKASEMMTKAAAFFRTVGQDASALLNGFPTGADE